MPVQPVPSPIPLLPVAAHEPVGVRLRHDPSLHRVRAGVYCDAIEWTSLKPWERYVARVHAFALTHPDAVLAFESALAVRGHPVFGEPRSIHIHDPDRRASDRYGDVIVHTSADPRAIERIGSIAVTSLADTVLDIGRVLPPAFGLAVADAAIRSDATVSAERLSIMAQHQGNSRGRARLRWIVARVDGRSESVGESVSRAVIEWCGFPAPELQHWFPLEGFHDRSDFWWPRLSIAGESDGYGKYGSDPDSVRNALLGEKRREDRIRRHVRGFARWDWADTMRVDPMCRQLLAAGVPLVRAPQRALLATLARNPRSI